MSFLTYLKSTAFSEWLSLSMLGFPTLIALHSIGMAVVVGLSLMIALRLNGVITALEGPLIPRLLSIAIWGFYLNFFTGLALFITRGPEYITSYIFLIKMFLVIVSAAILFWLRESLKSRVLASAAFVVTATEKRLSLVFTVTWFAAVVAGRLIAYLSDLYR